MRISAMLVAVLGLLGCSIAWGQTLDFPKRKAGMWEMKMENAQMPKGGMTALQCIDEATDAEIQKQFMSGGGHGGKISCQMTSVKKTALGTELDSQCTNEGTTISGHTVITGDMQSAYQMDVTSRMTPPINGRGESHSILKLKYLGACKPGMKPGDMNMNGITVSALPNAKGGKTTMSKEDIQRMIEEMKKAKQQQ